MTFENTLENLPENYIQTSFSLEPFIKKAVELSNNHPLISETINYLKTYDISPNSFNRKMLLVIWSNQEVRFSIKYILTMWWGGLDHAKHAPKFYIHENLDRLDHNSDQLNQKFREILDRFNEGEPFDILEELYNDFNSGFCKMQGIGVAFFTKVFQFYFHANNLENNKVLPIIADQWSMKAVLCDMIGNNQDWNKVFRPPSSKYNYVPSFKGSHPPSFRYYSQFTKYFHQRSIELQDRNLVKSSFELEEKIFGWGRDDQNPQNPRYYYRKTLAAKFGVIASDIDLSNMTNYKLSKSTFLRGLQCTKSLYLHKNNPDLKDELSTQQEVLFNQGNEVGLLAQQLFPGGKNASPNSPFELQKAVSNTRQFLEKAERIIYEATFQHNEVLAAIDILVKDQEGWKAYEVKSSTSIKPVNIQDAAVQYYTINGSGIDLVDISIVYINNQYLKEDAIELDKIFKIESVLQKIKNLQKDIPLEIERLKQVLESDSSPSIEIGQQCDEPYSCDFKGHCWKHIPRYSVFDIANLSAKRKFDLYKEGIVTLDQIDLDKIPLSPNQKFQVKSEQTGKTTIDHIQVGNFIDQLKYPIFHLDFETVSFPIPIYDYSRPYQQIPFQYSLHIEKKNSLDHEEFLSEATRSYDIRIPFIERLISDVGDEGDILVYNQSFEERILRELQIAFPMYNDQLSGIRSRLKDLMLPFKNKWHYSPKMKGSYSIKYVLPALVPGFTYNDLNIKEGGTASSVFAQMILGEYHEDINRARTDLKEYCKMDTRAMVLILEELRRSCKDTPSNR